MCNVLKRIVVIGLGSHAALSGVGFMMLAGDADIQPMIRFSAMTALVIWAVVLAIAMLIARRTWEHAPQSRKLGFSALSVPGWTLGLPLVLLYLLGSREGDDGAYMADD